MKQYNYSLYQKDLSLFVDCLLLLISLTTAYFARYEFTLDFNKSNHAVFLVVYISTWIIIISQTPFRILERGITFDKVLYCLFRHIALHFLLVLTVMHLLRGYEISRLVAIYTFISELILLTLWRGVYYKFISHRRRSAYNGRNIIVAGTVEDVSSTIKQLNANLKFGYNVIATLSDSNTQEIEGIPNYNITGHNQLLQEGVDEVFCMLTPQLEYEQQELIKSCEDTVTRVKIFPMIQKSIKKKVSLDFFDEIPLLVIRHEPLQRQHNKLFKRIFDIVFSLLVIILFLSWFTPLMALIIKLESKGPVFFKQTRTGRNNKEFEMLKFRSMGATNTNETVQAKKNDIRVTKIGRFIRRTSIDELPQFFNVLMGNMSIIGPRPHMVEHTELYSKIISQYMVRHFLKPGISGWAQVNGYRGETNTSELMQKRVQHDVYYIENWSFALDITIIFRTVINIIIGDENAY